VTDQPEADVVKSFSVPAVILWFLGSQDEPISREKLREKILASGYPQEKMGQGFSYFYTCLARLAKSKRILKQGKKVSLLKRTPVLSDTS
jgi:hypothetical protein